MRVVERVIGHKMGTGRSSGVDYLQQTTSKRCFPSLWDVRTVLTKGDARVLGCPARGFSAE
jgi:tryptophan 2,3-dioxygenase